MSFSQTIQPNLAKLRHSVWFFPAIATIILILLTCLRISGTSVGLYDSYFYGAGHKDSSLLFGSPQGIRSDEWLFNTQMIIAQSKDGFPHINHTIGSGRDMSLVVDAPYKDWSVIFKPQNLSFFVLPLGFAFAFKWWLLLYLLLISCYFFVLRLLPDKRLLASILSLGFGLSPFVFWWYQTITLAPLFYGFFIMLLGMRIINGEVLKLPNGRALSLKRSYLVYIIGLSYLLVSFGLLLYPPFQIPVALGVIFFLAGFLIQKCLENRDSWKRLLKRSLLLFIVSSVVAGCIGLAFIETRSNVIASIEHTVYPGSRVVTGGGYKVTRLLVTYLQPQLERVARGGNYFSNQSEASNFILLLPFLIFPGIYVTFLEYRKKHRIDWAFVAIQLCIALFCINLFVPGGQILYKLLLLDMVPHERMIIGLGFVGFIHMLLLVQKLNGLGKQRRLPLAAIIGYGVACLGVAVLAGYRTHLQYPLFISSWPLIIGGSLLFSIIVVALLSRKTLIAVSLLLVFSFVSIVKTDPLYQGLGPLTNNKLVSTIAQSPASTHWAAVDDQYIESFSMLANRDSLSGVQYYPDLGFWRQVAGSSYDNVYNRYAHIVFSTDTSTAPLYLVAPDHFDVQLACSQFIKKNLTNVVVEHQLTLPCVTLQHKIVYPARTFYTYKIQP
jgi:hypothetical protein